MRLWLQQEQRVRILLLCLSVALHSTEGEFREVCSCMLAYFFFIRSMLRIDACFVFKRTLSNKDALNIGVQSHARAFPTCAHTPGVDRNSLA